VAHTPFLSFSRKIAAGDRLDLSVPGRSLVITGWTGALDPQISIDDDSFYDIPQGLCVPTDGFYKLSIKNPNLTDADIKIAIGRNTLFFLIKPPAFTETDPIFSAWLATNPLAGFLTSETDPVFSAWDKSTGISISRDQITDFPSTLSYFVDDVGYLTAETDPLSLHLDQTAPQVVTGNMPIFQSGLALGKSSEAAGTLSFSDGGIYFTLILARTQTGHTIYYLPTESTDGLLRNTGGNWSWDNASYLTAEADPIFTAWLATNPLSAYETTTHAASTYQPIGSYLTDAPSNGNTYGRKNGAWSVVSVTETDPIFTAWLATNPLAGFVTSSALTPYAKLDATNQPFTGDLNISKATPSLTLTSTDESNNTAILSRAATSRALTLKSYVGTPSGNPTGAQVIASQVLNTATASKFSFAKNSPFTIEFWFNQGISHYGYLADQFIHQNGAGFYCSIMSANANSDTGLQFGLFDGTNYWYCTNYTMGLTNGTWYHLMLINDGAGNLSVYKNNAVQTMTPGGTYSTLGNTATNNGLYIKGESDFKPQVDEFIVWNKALDSTERAARYASGSGLYATTTANTVAIYHLDNDLTDSASNPANLSGTCSYVSGKVTAPPSAQQGTLFNYQDGTAAGEKGKAYLGDPASGTYLRGQALYFMLGASVEWSIDANGDLNAAEGNNIIAGTTTGTKIGTATTQKLGFYNATPIVQRAGAAQAAVATTASTQTTPWGYSTQAQADGIVTLVNEIRAALVALGLMKGAA